MKVSVQTLHHRKSPPVSERQPFASSNNLQPPPIPLHDPWADGHYMNSTGGLTGSCSSDGVLVCGQRRAHTPRVGVTITAAVWVQVRFTIRSGEWLDGKKIWEVKFYIPQKRRSKEGHVGFRLAQKDMGTSRLILGLGQGAVAAVREMPERHSRGRAHWSQSGICVQWCENEHYFKKSPRIITFVRPLTTGFVAVAKNGLCLR